jgi:hypothetical protein
VAGCLECTKRREDCVQVDDRIAVYFVVRTRARMVADARFEASNMLLPASASGPLANPACSKLEASLRPSKPLTRTVSSNQSNEVLDRDRTDVKRNSPDLPGCVATAGTGKEVQREMKDAIAFHLDGLSEEGLNNS